MKKIFTTFLVLCIVLANLLPIKAFASAEETIIQYRSRKIINTTSYSYPYYSDEYICYDSQPEIVLLATYHKCSIGEVNHWEDFWDCATVKSEKTHNIGYGYSKTPDGEIDYEVYQLEKATGETGIGGKTLYYWPGWGNVYYRGTTSGLYTCEVYSKYKYYYRKYGDWSSWSTTPIEETKDLDVETRVLHKRNVTFDLNGGSGILYDSVFEYHTLAEPQKPTKNGFEFLGWYKEPELTTAWDFTNDIITEDTTLYAKWGFDKNIIFFDKSNIESGKYDTIEVNPVFAVSDTNKAFVVKYKFDSNLLTYKNVEAGSYKYISAKVYDIDAQYSYVQVSAQYDTSGHLNSKEFITPYTLNFSVNDNAYYGITTIEIHNLNDAYVLNANSTKVKFEVSYSMNVNIIRSKVNSLEIVGKSTINLPSEYKVSVIPADADASVKWSVDNESIAQITNEGILKPKANGMVTITAESTDGSNISASKQISIENVVSYLDNIEFSDNCMQTNFDYETFNYRVMVLSDNNNVAFTPIFDDGLLIYDGEILFSGIQKNIDISINTVVTMSFIMTNAETSQYTIEFYKESNQESYNLECENIRSGVDSISFDIKATSKDETEGSIIVAWYDKCSMIDVEFYDGTSLVEFSMNKNDAHSFKIMYWKMDELRPLTKYIEIIFDEATGKWFEK